jgi:cytochrome c oxidase subunit IV
MDRPRAAQPVPLGGPGGHAALAAAEAHPSRARTYVLIFFLLFVITAAEVAVTYATGQLPQVPTLLTLATIKFFCIAAFYMHLKYDSRAFAAFFIIGLLLAAGMLFSFVAMFTAHPREPYVQEAPAQGQAAGTATPGAASTSPAR